MAPWANGIDGTALQYAPFIHAVNASDLIITGGGTIDSDGFFFYKANWCGGSGGEEAVYMTLPLYITQSNLTLVIEEGVRLKAKTDTVLSHAGAESEHHFVSSSYTGVVFVPSVSCKSSFCIHASSEHPPTKRLGCFW